MVEIIRGAVTNAIIASTRLDQFFLSLTSLNGVLFLGYPIIGSGVCIDALYVSPEYAVIAFDLIDDTAKNERSAERDAIYTALYSSFISNKDLTEKRNLLFEIIIISFSPASKQIPQGEDSDSFFMTTEMLKDRILATPKWKESSRYQSLLSAIQVATKIKAQPKRNTSSNTTKGARLGIIEKGIATLDAEQNKAVIETNDGPQRIRGLAGSGKTIILALKAAYLHARYPEMRIAITFNTRALKPMFESYITKFVWEYTKEEPDYSVLRILPSWGSPTQPGVYSEICLHNGLDYFDFKRSKRTWGNGKYCFDFVCCHALDEKKDFTPLFDIMLIDEAQDLPLSFLQLCLKTVTKDARLVIAYDELQRLNDVKAVDIEALFGSEKLLSNEQGKAKRDIILPTCYRNSKQVIVTAHSLGFGIYRTPKMVQIFDNFKLWKDVGYEVTEGTLDFGREVTLSRTIYSSPRIFEDTLRCAGEIVDCLKFPNQNEEMEWIAEQIVQNIKVDDLRYEDILVIYPDPVRVEANVGMLRSLLIKNGIKSHIAGVTTSSNSFFQEESITVSGIYRAKGNEAALVYILDAHFCASGAQLRKKRNILFTAITRSKGWVRICGFGDSMDILLEEYNKLKENNFQLSFRYPTREELAELEKIYSSKDKIPTDELTGEIETLLKKLKSKEISIESIPASLREQLSLFLSGAGDDR